MGVLFLDIETTGLSRAHDEITTIVWNHDNEWGHWVAGCEKPPPFVRDWEDVNELVTYNGKCFDEPFLRRAFQLSKHHSHTDLRWTLGRNGLKGGLKKISATQGIERCPGIQEVDGLVALDLWQEYRAGSAEALECLLYYNAWDVRMLIKLYNKFVLDLIPDSFPNFSINTDWLDDFLARRSARFSDQCLSESKWARKEPRSPEDLTLNIVNDLKDKQKVTEVSPWFGNVISFTGQMEKRDGRKLDRKVAREIANSVGFVWIEAPKLGCTHLIAPNQECETNKALKARDLGITISTPKEFWDFVDFG